MIAVDANVLVRLVVQDDPHQVARALKFVSEGVWVSTLVFAETIWLLSSYYQFTHAMVLQTAHDFLHHEKLTMEAPDALEAALASFRAHPKLGFNDCLIVALAHTHGHTPVGTFDKSLAKLSGVVAV